MKCYKCGNMIRDNIKYCPACGAELYVTQELLDAAKRNEEWATTDLYNRTFDKVFHAIYAMVKQKETTEDLLQDTYIKAFTSLSQLNEASKFDAWIKRIAHNQTVDYLRKAKPILFSELSQGEESDLEVEFEDTKIENIPEEAMDQKETARILGEMLNMLSEDQRVVVGMRASGCSFKEIGETLGVSENTVKYRFYAAQKKLTAEKEELEKKGIKLFGLAPMASLLALFSQDAAMAAELPNAAILQAVQAHLAVTGAAGAAGAAAGKVGAATAGKTGVTATGKTGAAVAAKTIGTRAIVGIVVVCVAGGTAAAVGGVTAYNHRQTAAEQYAESESLLEEETEGFEETDPNSAYQIVIAEFWNAMTIPKEEFQDYFENDSQDFSQQYPDVDGWTIWSSYNYDDAICYAYYDINSDGRDEMLVGMEENDYEKDPYIRVMDIYTSDGTNAYMALPVSSDRSMLTIYKNGAMVEHASSGAYTGDDIWYKIAGDGYTINMDGDMDYAYVYTDAGIPTYADTANNYPDIDYDNMSFATGVQIISENEYDALLAEYTEGGVVLDVSTLNWSLMEEYAEETSENAMGTTTDPADTAYQKILDEYLEAEADPDASDQEYCRTAYPDVSAYVMNRFHSGTVFSDLYYCYYDINGDGQDELIIGKKMIENGDNSGAFTDIYRIDDDISGIVIYAYNGEKAVKAIENESFDARLYTLSSLAIYENGGIIADWGCDDGAGTDFYVLDSDGYTADMTYSYGIGLIDGWEFDGYFTTFNTDFEWLSEADLNQIYQEQTGGTKEVDLDWKPIDEAIGGSNLFCRYIPVGEECSYDLDGDGVEETISVVHKAFEEDGWTSNMIYLVINGDECAFVDGALPANEYCIVDLDSSDATLQVGIQYSGEEADWNTAFYGYDSGESYLLGYMQGTLNADRDFEELPNIVCSGDGTIESYKLLDIFESWFASATWKLEGKELVEQVPSVYEPLDFYDGWGIDLTTLKGILVTTQDPYSGNQLTLPAGTKIHMTGTDNEHWVCFTADGYKDTLYLLIQNYNSVPTADSGDYESAIDVFDNLSMFG